ncbi:hypothetical protein H5410_056435 [Solanum commersonii]|uniref:Uncharacterized protein n=1 Tax=Solanum commersonii TaxID=4109 RepID=A0A9J5WLQ1_SOLCO|nr:hypothetical protein H5410_056435 [Solanum commersonii]
MTANIRITKRSIDYSTRKLAKWVLGPTGSIAKVLTDVHKIFRHKWRRTYGSSNDPLTIAHENWPNVGFTFSGARLTLKMGRFARRDQLIS